MILLLPSLPLDILGHVLEWVGGRGLSQLFACGDSRLNGSMSIDGVVRRFDVQLDPLRPYWPTSVKRFKSLKELRLYFEHPYNLVHLQSHHPISKLPSSLTRLELAFGNAPVILKHSLQCDTEFILEAPRAPVALPSYMVKSISLEKLNNLVEFVMTGAPRYSGWSHEYTDEMNCGWTIWSVPPSLTSLDVSGRHLDMKCSPQHLSNLTSLRFNTSRDWQWCFWSPSSFEGMLELKLLEGFSLNSIQRPLPEPLASSSFSSAPWEVKFPPRISSLSVSQSIGSSFMVGEFPSSLTRLEVCTKNCHLTERFWRILPAALINLAVYGGSNFSDDADFPDGYSSIIFPLPSGLTRFSLRIRGHFVANEMVGWPETLRFLELPSLIADDRLFFYQSLPRQLEHLIILINSDNIMTPEELRSLPPALTRLSTSSFITSTDLVQHLPYLRSLKLASLVETETFFNMDLLPATLTHLKLEECRFNLPLISVFNLLPPLLFRFTLGRYTASCELGVPRSAEPIEEEAKFTGWPTGLQHLKLRAHFPPLLDLITKLPPELKTLEINDENIPAEFLEFIPRGLTSLTWGNPQLTNCHLRYLPPTLASFVCYSMLLTRPFVDLLPRSLTKVYIPS